MSGATTRRRSRHPPWRRARPRGRCRAAGGSAGVTRSRAGCDYAQLGDHRGLSWAEGRPKEGCLSLGAARRDRDHRRLAGAGPPRYRQQVAGPTRRVRPRAPLGDGQRPLRRHSAGGGGASRRSGVAPATRLSVSYSLPPVAVALGRRALDIACATLATRVSRGVTRAAEPKSCRWRSARLRGDRCRDLAAPHRTRLQHRGSQLGPSDHRGRGIARPPRHGLCAASGRLAARPAMRDGRRPLGL